MLEFQDGVTEQWMMSFCGYKDKGFPNGLWTDYIKQMIETDKVKVEVFMKCSSGVLRARRIPVNARVMMQYYQEIGKSIYECHFFQPLIYTVEYLPMYHIMLYSIN